MIKDLDKLPYLTLAQLALFYKDKKGVYFYPGNQENN